MTNNQTETVSTPREVIRAIEISQQMERSAAEAATDDERRSMLRMMRAFDKAAAEYVKGNYPEHAYGALYLIGSRSTAGAVYRVDVERSTCTCESAGPCWHIASAEIADEIRRADAQAAKAEMERALSGSYLITPEAPAAPDDEDIPLAPFSPETPASAPDTAGDVAGDEMTEEEALARETLLLEMSMSELTSADELERGDDGDSSGDDEEIYERYDPIPHESLFEQSLRYQ